jgi:hypothetical protein
MAAEEYTKLFQPTDLQGNRIPLLETPLGIAVSRQEPAHAELTLRGADGVVRPIEATAFPLLAHAGEVVGAIAIFWERAEGG